MHRKILLLTTLCLFIGASLALYQAPAKARAVFDTSKFVTLGSPKAPVHLILFEEFACVQCKRFHLEDLPLIEQKYIDKGLVKLTTIPLAYLHASTPAFVASCCVASEGFDHHKAFLEHLFSLPEDTLTRASPKELIRSYALKRGDFKMKNVLPCLQSEKVYEILDANLKLSDDIHPGQIEMPTLLINGRFVEKIDVDVILKMIQEELFKASYYVEAA